MAAALKQNIWASDLKEQTQDQQSLTDMFQE